MKWILVFLGSGIGGCLRFFIGEQTSKWLNYDFPFGTLIANFIACIILGLVIGLTSSQWLDEKTRIFLAIGVCGGFSTFSTFSAETLQMISNQRVYEGILYVLISVFSCIGAVYFGTVITKWFS
jgi:CrcB protein